MADTWTISEAARLCGCDRRTLQRAIQSGRLHLDAQYRLSREALLTAGYLSAETPQDEPRGTPQTAPQMSSDLTPILASLERLIHAVEDVRQAVETLRADMRQMSQATPQAVLHGIETPQTAPRSTPCQTPQSQTGPHRAPQGAPHLTPQSRAGRPRSALGQRILQVLEQHPEGLSAEQIRAYVSPERPIGDILSGMRRTGAVQTVGQGHNIRYVLAKGEPSMHD